MSWGSEKQDLGEIFEESFDFKAVTWKISNALSLPELVNYEVQSPTFHFMGAAWRLVMFPYGQTHKYEGYISLYIVRLNSQIPEHDVHFTFCFKTLNGEEFDCFSGRFKSTSNPFEAVRGGVAGYLKKSTFMDMKNDLAPNGVLTIVCQMRIKRGSDIDRCFNTDSNASLLYAGTTDSDDAAKESNSTPLKNDSLTDHLTNKRKQETESNTEVLGGSKTSFTAPSSVTGKQHEQIKTVSPRRSPEFDEIIILPTPQKPQPPEITISDDEENAQDHCQAKFSSSSSGNTCSIIPDMAMLAQRQAFVKSIPHIKLTNASFRCRKKGKVKFLRICHKYLSELSNSDPKKKQEAWWKIADEVQQKFSSNCDESHCKTKIKELFREYNVLKRRTDIDEDAVMTGNEAAFFNEAKKIFEITDALGIFPSKSKNVQMQWNKKESLALLKIFSRYRTVLSCSDAGKKHQVWKRISDELRRSFFLNCTESNCKKRIEKLKLRYHELKRKSFEEDICMNEDDVNFFNEAKNAFEIPNDSDSMLLPSDASPAVFEPAAVEQNIQKDLNSASNLSSNNVCSIIPDMPMFAQGQASVSSNCMNTLEPLEKKFGSANCAINPFPAGIPPRTSSPADSPLLSESSCETPSLTSTDNKFARNSQIEDKVKSGKYVSPHKREGAIGQGHSVITSTARHMLLPSNASSAFSEPATADQNIHKDLNSASNLSSNNVCSIIPDMPMFAQGQASVSSNCMDTLEPLEKKFGSANCAINPFPAGIPPRTSSPADSPLLSESSCEAPSLTSTDNKFAHNSQVEDKVKSGKYVSSHKREGAIGQGHSVISSGARREANTVRVTNLSKDVRNLDLQELFRPFGPIAHIYLVKDKSTSESKGFAFITYHRREDAVRAILSVDGFEYDNRILTADWAKDKRDELSSRIHDRSPRHHKRSLSPSKNNTSKIEQTHTLSRSPSHRRKVRRISPPHHRDRSRPSPPRIHHHHSPSPRAFHHRFPDKGRPEMRHMSPRRSRSRLELRHRSLKRSRSPLGMRHRSPRRSFSPPEMRCRTPRRSRTPPEIRRRSPRRFRSPPEIRPRSPKRSPVVRRSIDRHLPESRRRSLGRSSPKRYGDRSGGSRGRSLERNNRSYSPRSMRYRRRSRDILSRIHNFNRNSQ